MKRGREDNPWAEQCYLGGIELEDVIHLINDMVKHKEALHYAYFSNHSKRFCICRVEKNVFSGAWEHRLTRFYTHWHQTLNYLDQLISRPIHRVETHLFRPAAIEKRTSVIVTWLLCAKRMGVIRDVAVMIGKIMRQWNLRGFI